MEGCITDVRKTIVEKLLNKAIEKSSYFFCFTRIVKEFNEEKDKLKAERATMGQHFKVATEKGKEIQSNAEFWEKQADKLIQENIETKQRYFLGFCPDCIWRYKRGEELATKTKVIKSLMEKGEKFKNIEIISCLPGVERYSSQYYISFKSRELKYMELLDALKYDNNYMVGLHGMAGAGKTTLAKEVGKQLKTLELFKYVIDTTVSFNVDMKKIQDDIAGSLGLEWGDINESDRPKRLWSRLTNGDKILVILDDVWENLKFDDIGIPNSDNHKGCKVLVTTRNLGVCNKMGCGKTIQLELLTEEDAWIMFKMHADLSNLSSKSILDKGRKIAIECKRLPIAIATIASSLKGKKSLEEWDVALNCLQKPVSMGNVKADLVDIFKCLKFSYDYLKDEKAKGLFLLCSAFPEDEEISVELLTRLGIGVNLFGEGYEKYNDARSQAVVAKNKLLHSCLLLETEDGDVKMHDLVREVAHWIANEEILVVDLSNKNQKSLLERNKNIKYLLFHGNLMDLFSSRFDGSKLEILIVRIRVTDFEDVPTSFFENMVGLQVLKLTNSFAIEYRLNSLSLPKSIQLLMNIRSLSVENVDLGDISVLGSLQSLETLELEWCKIDEFSPEIAMLKKLRLLSLRRCKIRSNNPFEVIQRCPSLEELYFYHSFKYFYQKITLPTLERYLLIDKFSDWNGSQSKGVALEGDRLSEATYKYVMKTSYYLHLIRIKGWINLMPAMVPIVEGMNDLIELRLGEISQLQCLVDTKHVNSQEPIVFSKLVVLELKRMEALEELCNGPISVDFMNNLEELYIEECENLRSLFKCRLNLSNLKTVKLEKCSRLVSVFELSTSQSLPLLEELKIIDCEKLENIITFERRAMDDTIEESANGYNDDKSCHSLFPKLKVLHIVKCHQLQCLVDAKHINSQGPIVFSKLKVLKLWRMKNLEQLCTGPIFIDSMNNLEKLSIKYCQNLRSLFKCSLNPSNLMSVKLDQCPRLVSVFELSTSQSLPLLQKLKIIDCEKLENIITIEESVDGYDDNKSCYSLFPKLKVLKIERCHQLQFILPILSAQDLLLLEGITICCCHKLRYIFGQHQDVKLPSLETVYIEDLPNFIDICPPNASSISKHDSKPQTQLDPIKSNTFSMCCYGYKLSTKIPLVSEDQPQDCSISLESNSYCLNISEDAQCLSRQSHFLCNSKEIFVFNFSKIKSVFILSIAPRMLETLSILNCDELKQIIIDTGDHNSTGGNNLCNVFTKLKTLWVENCVQLEYIFGHYNHDHQNHTEIHPHLPPFANKSMDGPIIKELSSNEENRQQMNLSLEDIRLIDLPMMTCLFVGLKYSFVLNNLTAMYIHRCEKLEIVFSTSILRCLPQLVSLSVEKCKQLKHIIEDDLEDKNFRSSSTCFPKLETLIVTECDKLKYVFPVSICNEFPKLEAMLIREANELEEIFRSDKKDEVEEISKSEVEIPNLKVVAFAYLPSLCHDQGVHFQTVKYRYVLDCQKLSLTSAPFYTFHDDDILDFCGDEYFKRLFSKLRYEFHNADSFRTQVDFSTDGMFADRRTLLAKLQFANRRTPDGKLFADRRTLIGKLQFAKRRTLIRKLQKELRDEFYEAASEHQLTSPQELMNEQLMDQQCLMNHQQTLAETDITIKPSQEENLEGPTSEITAAATVSTITHEVVPKQKGIQINVEEGNASTNTKTITTSNQLDVAGSSSGQLVTSECKTSSQEGSTSEITEAATVSTITETENKPATQEVVPKLKGIQTNIEGNTSANAKTITSSTHSDVAGSSSGQLVTSECKTSSQEDVDSQIAMTSFSISTTETDDQGSLNHESFKKVSSNIEEQFPKDEDKSVSKSKPSPSITSLVAYQFPSVHCKDDPSQKAEDLSSSLLVKSDLEQLVSKNHLDCGNLSLLTDFFFKHPSVSLKDTSLSNRYKGCAYNVLAKLLKFLKTHSILEVLESFHSEFEELLQDARSFGFDKDWLDGVERRTLCPDMQVSQDVLKKLLDSKEHVTKEVEVLRFKIGILSEQMEDISEYVEVLKHQLASSQAVLESIIQQEVALSAPVGY